MSCPTFRDGEKSINFVLVYKTTKLETDLAYGMQQLFLENLFSLGIELEFEVFSADESIIFVKLHAPDDLITSYSGLFDVYISCLDLKFHPKLHHWQWLRHTPLTLETKEGPEYERAPESMSGAFPKTITSAERIMVVQHLLSRCFWGDNSGDFGIRPLIKKEVFIDYFPLHDGDYEWTDTGPLNDRQLLAKYWGSISSIFSAQPLNLIERYYGTEYALYFAWMSMYVKHLIPTAILSILVLLYGILTLRTRFNHHAHVLCNSDRVMCPRCHYAKCPMVMLNSYCYMAHASYVFDNWSVVVFSAIVSIWSTVFMENWQREESVLQLHWGSRTLDYTATYRPEYLERTHHHRYSVITEKLEPYTPKHLFVLRYGLSVITVFLLLTIMLAATVGVMVYRSTVALVLIRSNRKLILTDRKYSAMIASVSGAFISALFICIFKVIYVKLALYLTYMETHRTVISHHSSYIYKNYALAFVNHYSAVFYIAFFKGKFFTHPGDMEEYATLGGIGTDQCDPAGCTIDLGIQLVIIMCVKAFINNVLQIFTPKLEKMFKTWKVGASRKKLTHQWEKEYLLAEVDEFFIVGEYMDMGSIGMRIDCLTINYVSFQVIQYGFVNFFIIGFPLSPLFALINNIFEIRTDSCKITKSYRRPVPMKLRGLGAWFAILQATTYIGVATNALTIAFTSLFMEKHIWHFLHGDKSSGLDITLSEFAIEDFEIEDSNQESNFLNVTSGICYYTGKRYPPSHPLKYQNQKYFWLQLALKFIFVVIFEHVVVTIKGLVAYGIPDIPFSVKQQIAYQNKLEKSRRIEKINEEYMKQKHTTKKTSKKKRS